MVKLHVPSFEEIRDNGLNGVEELTLTLTEAEVEELVAGTEDELELVEHEIFDEQAELLVSGF